MFQNFLKTLTRHLYRNRLFTILNIIGLSVCICVAWMIFRIVSYEYSFDKKIPDAENIYMLVSKSQDQGASEAGTDYFVTRPVYSVVKNDIAGIESAVPVFTGYIGNVQVQTGKGQSLKKFEKGARICTTTTDYFRMFGYHWIAGNPSTALDAPDQVVLTDKRAEEYFPSADPREIIGKTIIYDDSLFRHVSGVVTQLPAPNSFNWACNEFISLNKKEIALENWGARGSGDLVFFKPVKNGSPQHIIDQLNRINQKLNQENFEKYKYKDWYSLLPLKELHSKAGFGPQSLTNNMKVLNGLMITGFFLLLLACINYINISTSMLPGRAKEIGILKTLGSSSRQITLRFMGETLAVILMSVICSFLLTIFAVRLFADFLPEGLSDYLNYKNIVIFLLTLIVGVTLLSGLYPAWLSTKVKTVNVLKGATTNIIGRESISLRKGLIVFQFLIAQIFIIGSIVIYQQLQYALHKDLGFDKNGVITFYTPWAPFDSASAGKYLVLKNEILRNSGVEGVSIGNAPMEGARSWTSFVYYDGQSEIQKEVYQKFADTGYLRLYKLRLLAGRNYAPADSMNELVINETAAHAFGFHTPQEAVGKMLVKPGEKNHSYPIVGVVRDFDQEGVQTKIYPLLIATNKYASSKFNVRLAGNQKQWSHTLGIIGSEWKKLYPADLFNYTFYDQTIENFYQKEEKMQTLVSSVTVIAIIIACLGLFGLATLTIYRRTKEVGIRKVLGASIAGIVRLLSKEFLTLVLISVVIASPIAWWLLHSWLQNFAYRIDIRWWIFILAGLLACIIAIATISYQAIKAAKVNPVESLKTE